MLCSWTVRDPNLALSCLERQALQAEFERVEGEILSGGESSDGFPTPKKARGMSRRTHRVGSYATALLPLGSSVARADKFDKRKQHIQALISTPGNDSVWLVFYTRTIQLLANPGPDILRYQWVTYRSRPSYRSELVS